MCFSAQASFGATVVLSFLGALTLKKSSQKTRLIALMPFVFAIQQAAEGIVWVASTTNNMLALKFGTYTFIFFAFIWWPLSVPLGLMRMESDPDRKRWLALCCASGFLVASYLLYIVVQFGVTPEIMCNHIYYAIATVTPYKELGKILYLIATAGSFVISSVPYMPLFGLLVSIAYAITFIFYYYALTSVWCFFAALISGLLFFLLPTKKMSLGFSQGPSHQ